MPPAEFGIDDDQAYSCDAAEDDEQRKTDESSSSDSIRKTLIGVNFLYARYQNGLTNDACSEMLRMTGGSQGIGHAAPRIEFAMLAIESGNKIRQPSARGGLCQDGFEVNGFETGW